MNKYIVEVQTNWCGEDNNFSIIAENPYIKEIEDVCELAAYDNFSDFGGFDQILEELFPEVEDENYTDAQHDEAAQVEGGYYSYNIVEYDEEEHGNFDWYDLIYKE